MKNTAEWFTPEVNSLLKEIKDINVDTLYIAREVKIYSITNKLMELCRDYKVCQSSATKAIIYNAAKDLAKELRQYRVYDSRFDEPFDDGK